jgi:hypothetical protein
MEFEKLEHWRIFGIGRQMEEMRHETPENQSSEIV